MAEPNHKVMNEVFSSVVKTVSQSLLQVQTITGFFHEGDNFERKHCCQHTISQSCFKFKGFKQMNMILF